MTEGSLRSASGILLEESQNFALMTSQWWEVVNLTILVCTLDELTLIGEFVKGITDTLRPRMDGVSG